MLQGHSQLHRTFHVSYLAATGANVEAAKSTCLEDSQCLR